MANYKVVSQDIKIRKWQCLVIGDATVHGRLLFVCAHGSAAATAGRVSFSIDEAAEVDLTMDSINAVAFVGDD